MLVVENVVSYWLSTEVDNGHVEQLPVDELEQVEQWFGCTIDQRESRRITNVKALLYLVVSRGAIC